MRLRFGDLLAVFIFYLASPGTVFLEAAALPTQVCLSEDNQTCLFLSSPAAQELLAIHNSYKEDIQLKVQRLPGEEVGETLRSIQITATDAGGQVIPDFAFKNPVELRLGNWTLFQMTGSRGLEPTPLAPIGDVRQWLGIYWDNGQGYIRLAGLSLDANRSLSIVVHNSGHYRINVVKPASTLHLARGSPYPRIITPNGRYNRRAFFFVDTPSADPIMGTIYDFLGAKVRDLHIDATSAAPNALTWDGRDASGNVVPSGPYFYKITAGDQNVSGSLVVAR